MAMDDFRQMMKDYKAGIDVDPKELERVLELVNLERHLEQTGIRGKL
jgi:CBS-domain-containing membrane protein